MTPKPTYPNLSESQLLAMLRHVLLALRLLHRKKVRTVRKALAGSCGSRACPGAPHAAAHHFSLSLSLSLLSPSAPPFLRTQLAHLDVKPGNIFWRGDLYKLGDFGMVTKVGVPGNEWDVEGDSCYLAPEVMKFRCPEDAARADLRKADIFGLGATVFAVIVRRELPQSGPLWHELRQNRDLSELERMLTAASSQQELLQQQQLRRAAQRSSSASDLMEEDGDAAIDGVQAFARHALGAGQRPASASAAAAGGMAALSDEFKALLQSMVRANPAERPCVEELLGSKLLCSAKDRQLTEAQERASALEAEVAELRAKLGSAQTQTQTQTQDIQK
jgi:serine/threonine protein kinase